ncbi:MAG: hypothetical protein J0H29_13295 [Sphingobacteriales bacterium]|nr:hypothetical protein [Sphingobacteriales bacterium]OJY86353.1 MAG: hypothetical protein BGP14_20475 [Sphingobacteriales bacterium 44-15]
MTLDEIKAVTQPYTDKLKEDFIIDRKIFAEASGRANYNKTVREKIEKKVGVYIWLDDTRKEIIYIGKAGSIGRDGSYKKHSIQNRLTAPRGKNKATNKYIQTNDYVKAIMTEYDISHLSIVVIYSKEDEPPAYIEALLLYHFYKKNKRLPKLNNSF